MKIYVRNFCMAVLASMGSLTSWGQTAADGYAPIVIDTSYEHTKWGIAPENLMFHFAAFTSSFDDADDNNHDGKADVWGIPEWVAYEVKAFHGTYPDYDRPKWNTIKTLNEQGIVPNDATYAVSGTRTLKECKTDYRYVRGHLCPKKTADRISENAGSNTHTMLNAVPQLQWQNNGIWKALELAINDWADKKGRIWVITGPVFFEHTPSVWLGQDDEVKAAVPDALFKIVIQQSDADQQVTTLAFLIPNVLPKSETNYADYITSIDRIEALTDLDFLTTLSLENQATLEAKDANLSAQEKAAVLTQWLAELE